MQGKISNFFTGSQPVVLVAGGAGFIGSHFCQALLSKKLKVICVDNWQTGLRENITHLEEDENFLLIEQNIEKNFNKTIDRVDYIVHLVGIEAYINGEGVSIQTLSANSVGTRNLLDLAKLHQAKFLLASVIDIFSAKITKDSSKLSHLEARRFAEALVSEYGQKENVDVRIVRLGDVYGPRMLLSIGNPIARLFKQAVYNQPLVVSSEGVLYPIFISDVVAGLTKALFTSGTKNTTIVLAGPATHIVSFAQAIKGISPSLDVKLQDTNEVLRKEAIPDDVLLSGRAIISWEPEVSISEGINITLEWFNKHKSKPVKEEKSEKKSKRDFWNESVDIVHPKTETIWDWKRTVFVSLVIFLLWFFVLPPVFLVAGMLGLSATKVFLDKGDYDKTRKTTQVSRWFLEKSESGFEKLFFAQVFVDKARNLKKTILIVQKTNDVLEDMNSLAGGIFGKEEYPLQDIVQKASLNLAALEEDLAFAQSDGGEELSNLRSNMRAVLEILPQSPEILGQTKKKTYALLVQDNTELRPTGGLVSVIVFLTFEQGRLTAHEVRKVEDVESLIKGGVEPPDPIKKYLGQTTWLLHDANWNPNFPTTGRQIVWFLDKAERQVDGVVAVDLETIRDLLKVLGQPGSDNFYGEAEKAKDNTFLASVVDALITKIASDPKRNITSLGKVFLRSLEKKHASIWFTDRELAARFKNTGWDGSVKNLICPKTEDTECIKDFIFPVEANLGVNRTNAFLARTYSLEVGFEEAFVSHKLLISYNNSSQAGSWPGGDYKNYLRVFVPKEAQNASAMLFSPDDRDGKNIVIDEGEEVGKKVLGMLVNVPASANRQVEVSWELPKTSTRKGRLLLFVQKQPGLGDDPLWVKIDLPGGSQGDYFPLPSLTNGDSLGYNTLLASDFFANITWQQKQ